MCRKISCICKMIILCTSNITAILNESNFISIAWYIVACCDERIPPQHVFYIICLYVLPGHIHFSCNVEAEHTACQQQYHEYKTWTIITVCFFFVYHNILCLYVLNSHMQMCRPTIGGKIIIRLRWVIWSLRLDRLDWRKGWWKHVFCCSSFTSNIYSLNSLMRMN